MDTNGFTPLDITTQIGNLKLAQLLLGKGAQIKDSSLLWAAAFNQIELARLFFSKGSEVVQDPFKMTVSYCISKDFYDCKGEKVEDIKTDCSIFLKFCNNDMIELLLANGADPEGSDFEYLQMFIRNNNVKMLRLLLKYGADVIRVQDRFSPLGQSIDYQNAEVVKLLLDQPGIDVNCCIPVNKRFTSICENLIYWATQSGEVDLVKLWMEKGAYLNWEIHGDISVEIVVADAKNDEEAAALLNLMKESGANISYIGKRDPPFMIAMSRNFMQTSLTLIENGISYHLWSKT